MSTAVEQIKQFFKGHNIPLSTEWLESCIEWCKDGNLPPNYTIKDLQKMVYEQWLILDLREAEVASLPRGIADQKKYTLTGNYCLQIIQIIDISKPKFWQIQRIRNNVSKNIEQDKDFGKRVLQLTLTDGIQEVEAVEFKPINCLNINLLPGSKLRIIGPVVIRRGRLMLKEENVKFLGGAVDELKVKYAAENVLARALHLEENPNPNSIDEAILDVTEANSTTQASSTVFTQNYSTLNIQIQQKINQNNQRNPKNLPHLQTSLNIRKKDQEISPEFEVDDVLLNELVEEFEDNVGQKTPENSRVQQNSRFLTSPNTLISDNSNRNGICRSPDLFEEMGVDDELLNEHLDQIDVANLASNVRPSGHGSISIGQNSTRKFEYEGYQSENYSRQNGCGKSNKVVQDFEISSSAVGKKYEPQEDVIKIDDSFDDIDIDSHLDNIDEEMANLPSSTQVRNDIKQRIGSPILKRRVEIRDGSPTLSFRNSQRKLNQTTLRTSKIPMPGSNSPSRLNLDIQKDRENPFSIFHKPASKKNESEGPSYLQSPPRASSPDFTSKPSTSALETSLTKLQSSPKPLNTVPIEKLRKMIPNIGKGKFKIKGKFTRVAEKLQSTETSYHFVIVVSDESGELTVQMHSDLVTKITEVEPKVMERWRRLTLQNDVDVRKQIVRVLKALHAKCTVLDDILEVQITRGEKYPVLVNIL